MLSEVGTETLTASAVIQWRMHANIRAFQDAAQTRTQGLSALWH